MSNLNVVVKTTQDTSNIWLYATLSAGFTTSIPLLPTNTPVQLSTLTGNSFAVPVGFSGRIYFFLTNNSSLIPSTPSGIDTSINVRYDWVEMTNDGTPTAATNLTSVDQFGIALTLQTQNSSGAKISSVGYNQNAQAIISALTALAPNAICKNNGSFIRACSPLHKPAAYPSLDNYLSAINGQVFYIEGMFDGNPTLNLLPSGFSYTCTFNYTSGGTLQLVPTSSSQLTGTIEIPTSSLMDMIYACDGSFNVPGTTAGIKGNGTGDTVGYNDAWSTVVRNFLVGFNVGYYGYKPAAASNGYQYNCDHSWDWSPSFAYKYEAGSPTTPYYNQYASLIYTMSNSYGFPFSDFIGKPLVSLANVDTLQISLLGDTETNSDYTAPPTGTLSPVNYTNPTSGNAMIAIIFDCGVNQPMYYNGNIDLMGINYATGYNCWYNNNPAPQASIQGGCTVNNIPCQTGSICQYDFTIQNKPFSLYIKTDSSGKITGAITDLSMNVTVAASLTSVTISNIYWSIPQELPA